MVQIKLHVIPHVRCPRVEYTCAVIHTGLTGVQGSVHIKPQHASLYTDTYSNDP